MELLRENKLENGLQLNFYNGSKQVAGDRWLVVLKIVSKMPLSEKMIRHLECSEASKFLLNKFNGSVSFEIERKRHFVDEKQVDEALHEMMVLAETNMAEYFARPDFSQHLFAKKLEQFKEEFLLDQHCTQNEAVPDAASEEPVDFSACFK